MVMMMTMMMIIIIVKPAAVFCFLVRRTTTHGRSYDVMTNGNSCLLSPARDDLMIII
jgi:hypothetical protein